MRTLVIGLCIALFTIVDEANAQERAIEGTSIIGNKESPKSLYIVPWKKSVAYEISARPEQTLLDEVLQTLDREEFVRELRHHQATTNPIP